MRTLRPDASTTYCWQQRQYTRTELTTAAYNLTHDKTRTHVLDTVMYLQFKAAYLRDDSNVLMIHRCP
jgi:hypothetical protein